MQKIGFNRTKMAQTITRPSATLHDDGSHCVVQDCIKTNHFWNIRLGSNHSGTVWNSRGIPMVSIVRLSPDIPEIRIWTSPRLCSNRMPQLPGAIRMMAVAVYMTQWQNPGSSKFEVLEGLPLMLRQFFESATAKLDIEEFQDIPSHRETIPSRRNGMQGSMEKYVRREDGAGIGSRLEFGQSPRSGIRNHCIAEVFNCL